MSTYMTRHASLEPGAIVAGHYRVEALLGRGGMGEVYQVADVQLNKPWALKVLLESRDQDPVRNERFLQEARLAATLQHPGIVQVVRFGLLEDHRPFLLMELVPGESLSAWLDKGPLSVDMTIEIILQLLDALQVIHASMIVHRDIKPDNLRVFREGSRWRLKILDFGIARGARTDRPPLTGTDHFLGTIGYASPEQLRNAKGVDARSDLYAVGALTFHLLTGEHSTGTGSLAEVVSRILQGQIERHPRVYRSSIPTWLDQWVARALASEPEARFQSAEEMAEELEQSRRIWGTEPAKGQRIVSVMETTLVCQDARAGMSTLRENRDEIATIGATDGTYAESFAHVPSEPGTATAAVSSAPSVGPGSAIEWSDSALPDWSNPKPSAIRWDADRQRAGDRTWRQRWRWLALLPVTAVVALSTWYLSVSSIPDAGPELPPGMSFVPGGTFEMGSRPEEIQSTLEQCRVEGIPCRPELLQRERPLREVSLSPFFLDVVEVTNARFASWLQAQSGLDVTHFQQYADADGGRVVDAIRVRRADGVLLTLLNPEEGGLEHTGDRFVPRRGLEDHPVHLVTWTAADAYCRSLGYHLPTEAQWEWAARGKARRVYPWGKAAPDCSRVTIGRLPSMPCASISGATSLVGSSSQDRTPEGVMDMGGNVAEWVADGFIGHYPPCERGCLDPLVPASGPENFRVFRGGSWRSAVLESRGAGRGRWPETEVLSGVGFRCAAAVSESAAP